MWCAVPVNCWRSVSSNQRAQRRAARLAAANPDVLREETGECIEVAHVERERIARRELADLLGRFDAIETSLNRCDVVRCGQSTSLAAHPAMPSA